MINRKLYLSMVFAIVAIAGMAQSSDFGIWTNVDFKKKLFKGFDVTAGGEFRTRDNSKKVERWAAMAGMDYEITKNLKLDGGYSFIYNNVAERTTSKGNIVSSYWTPRHRLYFSVTGDFNLGRFNLSLRERYQYTYRHSKWVSKYDSDGEQKSDEEIKGKGSNIIRTRPMVKYNIRHSTLRPYVSFEMYNSINDKMAVDKTRLRVGTTFKLGKNNGFDLYYLFQNHADDDEPKGHVLGIGYTYNFK